MYNDAICIRMLQMLQITCGFLSLVVHKLCKRQWNFKQVDILISKNQALQIIYLKHIKLHKLATMDSNPRKFNPHKRYCTVLLLYYNSEQNIPYNWPTEQILTRIISMFLISYALFN